MKKRLLYLLFTCLIFASCKKNELPKTNETEGTPVFYFKCNVNGVPMKIEAGINNYAMNSSFYQDVNNLYVFKGELKQASCSGNCGFGLSVLINDHRLSELNAPMFVDSALRVGTNGFNDGSIKTLFYSGTFTSPLSAGDSYAWTFSDSSPQITTSVATRTFDANKTYTVRLFHSSAAGNSSQLSKEFMMGNPLQVEINESYALSIARFSATPVDAAYTYTWNFGDHSPDSISNLVAPDHKYDLNFPLSYTASLTLADLKGNTCKSTYDVKPASTCNANFTSVIMPVLNQKLFSAITIIFTDQNGISYSSADLTQPVDSKFEIISVENYNINPNNEPTKKLKIKFNCSFKSANGTINLTDGEAVIAVSYK